MNSAQARYLERKNVQLYRHVYEFERGKLVIISDQNFLRCVIFGRRQKLLDVPGDDLESRLVRPLEKAVIFFNAYFSSRKIPHPPIDLDAFTEGEKKVYKTLCAIPAGQTISYGELARLSGYPGGARFVGNTMAKNIFPIIIPCHRVIRSDGSPGNYSSGTELKEFLLRHEGTW